MEVRQLLQQIGPDTSATDMNELLAHPDTDEAHILSALRRRNLASIAIEAIARHDRWNARYSIKAAIVNHPKTPTTLALRLLSLLFWKELLRVSSNFRLTMPVRVAAETHLAARLRKLELGERISLARSAPPRVISMLLEQAHPRVIEALLVNPKLRELEVQELAGANVSPDTLRVLSQSERWSSRMGVKLALIKNRRTPVHAALRLLGSLQKRDITKLMASNELPRVVELRARQILSGQPPSLH